MEGKINEREEIIQHELRIEECEESMKNDASEDKGI